MVVVVVVVVRASSVVGRWVRVVGSWMVGGR